VRGRRYYFAVLLLAAMLAAAGSALAGDDVDVDLWHQQLAEAIGPDAEEAPEPGSALGLFPHVGIAGGPPNWIAGQAGVYVSFSNGRRFSLYGGYSYELGPRADAQVFTIGWGGVRPLPAATPQLGFHGKYLRYRQWTDDVHGVHHGLSLGTESGLGSAAVSFEMGAARSPQNHWLVTLGVCLKFAAPIHIPLGHHTRPPAQ
jgi:hypothetical protein